MIQIKQRWLDTYLTRWISRRESIEPFKPVDIDWFWSPTEVVKSDDIISCAPKVSHRQLSIADFDLPPRWWVQMKSDVWYKWKILCDWASINRQKRHIYGFGIKMRDIYGVHHIYAKSSSFSKSFDPTFCSPMVHLDVILITKAQSRIRMAYPLI